MRKNSVSIYGFLALSIGFLFSAQDFSANAQSRPKAKTKAVSNAWPTTLTPLGRAFPNANSPCKVLGENAITSNFLDDSATLVGCLTRADALRLRGQIVGTHQNIVMVSVPKSQTPAVNNIPSKAAPVLPPSSDWREIAPENLVLMKTTKGQIIIELAQDFAPNHAQRIRDLARAKFYDGISFHRVIDGFMAQGGDPKGDGTGDSTLPDLLQEFMFRRSVSSPYVKAQDKSGFNIGWMGSFPVTSQADLWMARTIDGKVAAYINHCPSITSMARSGNPNSGNSQFFLMREKTPDLDAKYSVWGRALSGLDVIRALKTGEPVIDPDRMTEVRVFSDLPEAQRPRVFVEKPESQRFQAKAQAAIAAKGAAFSNCDLMPDAQVIAPY